MYRELTQQKKKSFLRVYIIFFVISISSLFLLLFYDIRNGFLGIYYIQALAGNLVGYFFGGWEGGICILISIILLHHSRIRSSVLSGIFGIILICTNFIFMVVNIYLMGNLSPYGWIISLGSGFYVGLIPLTGFIILNTKLSKYRDLEFEKKIEERKKQEMEIKMEIELEVEELRKKREMEKEEQITKKIKNIIFEHAKKFDRIKISEIKEKIGIFITTDKIISKLKDLIENNEIQARYFSNTSTIQFEKTTIVQEILNKNENDSPRIIPDEKKLCIVCKGEIKHLFYECANCIVYYHLKCAIQLKDDNKACFSCGKPFPILPKLPEKSEILDEKKDDDPIVISLQNISDELAGYLVPIEFRHKDHSAQFNMLKKNLQDELSHKISMEFFEEFSPEIEELFKEISNIDVEDLPALENIKNYQKQVFHEIIESLKHLEGHCNNCGNRIMELSQKICEYCGEPLNKSLK